MSLTWLSLPLLFGVDAFLRISVLKGIFICRLSVVAGYRLPEMFSRQFIDLAVSLFALVYRLCGRSVLGGILVRTVYGHFRPSRRLCLNHSFLSFQKYHGAMPLMFPSSCDSFLSLRTSRSACNWTMFLRRCGHYRSLPSFRTYHTARAGTWHPVTVLYCSWS